MSCKKIKPWLPELAGGELGPKERRACEEHLGGCADCRRQLDELSDVVGRLRRAGQKDEVPAGFAASLHLRLSREPPPRRPVLARWADAFGRLGLGDGARLSLLLGAAGLALLALVVSHPGRLGFSPIGTVAEGDAPFQVPSQRVAVVNFNFVTNVLVDKVDFEVTLPRELAFIDNGKPLAQRTLQWSGSLNAGSNQIPLAISGKKPGRYKIVARARGEGVDVRHDVLLEVVSS